MPTAQAHFTVQRELSSGKKVLFPSRADSRRRTWQIPSESSINSRVGSGEPKDRFLTVFHLQTVSGAEGSLVDPDPEKMATALASTTTASPSNSRRKKRTADDATESVDNTVAKKSKGADEHSDGEFVHEDFWALRCHGFSSSSLLSPSRLHRSSPAPNTSGTRATTEKQTRPPEAPANVRYRAVPRHGDFVKSVFHNLCQQPFIRLLLVS